MRFIKTSELKTFKVNEHKVEMHAHAFTARYSIFAILCSHCRDLIATSVDFDCDSSQINNKNSKSEKSCQTCVVGSFFYSVFDSTVFCAIFF